MTDQEFKLEVVQRLATIETLLSRFDEEFEQHTDQDAVMFGAITAQLTDLTVDSRVAKIAGARSGAKWAAGIAPLFIGCAEAIRWAVS